jgi:hypothetical protein
MTMKQAQLRKLIVGGEVTLADVIDVVIQENAIIGVGLISLGDDIYNYIVHKPGRK